jgi:hypothetical protein
MGSFRDETVGERRAEPIASGYVWGRIRERGDRRKSFEDGVSRSNKV